jgi:hypothetical protein
MPWPERNAKPARRGLQTPKARHQVLAVLSALAVAGAGQAESRFVDGVVAEVDGAAVTASDVALVRALGLFGLVPATGPVSAADVESYMDGLLLVREATRIAAQETAAERAEAWAAVATRAGGEATLRSWLRAADIDEDWARRMVDEDFLRRRFIELRFRALAFVSEAEVAASLGPGPHEDADREATRARLEETAVSRRLAEWLVEARARGWIRRLADSERIPDPLPAFPGAAGRP